MEVLLNAYLRKAMNKNQKYIFLAGITGLFLQFGFMTFVALLLLWFHENAKEITSIIGLLSLIIGVALAHLSASILMNYVVNGVDKKELNQKGNNYATVFLVVVIPFVLYPFLDWLENNLTQIIYYSSGVSSILIGVVLSFYLNFLAINPED